MTIYEIHPAATIFPMMDDESFAALKADIKANGLKVAGELYGNQVIDGRNRYKACQELGMEMEFWEIDDSDKNFDPIAYVLSRNLYRRHLTESQRSIIAGKLAKLKVGDNQHSKEGGQICPPSIEQAADMLNVGTTTVKQAKQVLDAGAEEIVEAVQRGELPVSFAAKVVAEEPDKKTQAQLWKDGGKAALKAHISEASTYADADDELRVSATKTIAKMWKKWNAVERAAVRVWIDEHFLDSED